MDARTNVNHLEDLQLPLYLKTDQELVETENSSEMCSILRNYKCLISSKLEVEDRKREQEMVEHLNQAVQI